MKKTLKVYRQAIILFVTIIILVLGTNVFFYLYNLQQIRNNINKQIQQSTDFAIRQLEGQISYIHQYSRDVLNRPELKYISYTDSKEEPWEYYSAINELRYKLNSIKVSNDFINNSMVFIRDQNIILSANEGIISVEDSSYKDIFLSSNKISRLKIEHIGSQLYLFDFQYPYERTKSMAELNNVLCLEIEIENLFEYIKIYLDDNIISLKILEDDLVLAEEIFIQDIDKYIGKTKIVKVSKELESTNQVIEFTFQTQILGYNYMFLSIIMGVCFILAGFGIMYYVTRMNKLIHKPIKKIIKAFKNVEAGCYNVEFNEHETEEFNYLYDAISNIVARLDASIKNQYEQELALKESEIKQYQLQINPHFLYNGFYNIQRMCTNGQYEKATLLSKRLASYYRHITRNGIYFVKLQEEIKHMEDYIDIQTIRFQERIKINKMYNINEIQDIRVPRLIFQPMLENIYEHAFDHMETGGDIYIYISITGDYLKCTIEDTGIGMDDQQMKRLNHCLIRDSGYVECTGILNVNKRLKLHYGHSSGLIYKRREDGAGIKIEMKVNLLKEEENNV